MAIRATLLVMITTLGLTACSQGTPTLMNLRNTESGPDEFAIVPTNELELPADRSTLPVPTRGGPNRADPNPEADAIAALGGNIERANGNAGGLVGHASRFGVAPDIRSTLAAEDLAFRGANDGRLLERLFGTNVYFRAYRQQSLDRYAELERLRRAGVQTPSAPPPGL
ncbi:pyruvate/2-oxoglutarate dehydrogenase complex, dihydrolipoamide acyltransferase (E2) component [Jannaschia sp. EhC01]|nr:pyruvate/2-oxoglutarate dehydrogenase complex, dihydrolipoamide acyltransferase (E2) component [Jannaschia sp. EhC01]